MYRRPVECVLASQWSGSWKEPWMRQPTLAVRAHAQAGISSSHAQHSCSCAVWYVLVSQYFVGKFANSHWGKYKCTHFVWTKDAKKMLWPGQFPFFYQPLHSPYKKATRAGRMWFSFWDCFSLDILIWSWHFCAIQCLQTNIDYRLSWGPPPLISYDVIWPSSSIFTMEEHFKAIIVCWPQHYI